MPVSDGPSDEVASLPTWDVQVTFSVVAADATEAEQHVEEILDGADLTYWGMVTAEGES